ncbi:hypothetical protein [Fontivita pretiosa]|uniref:hypothetical protein n=1 Tax=Fontivita pretiosa TaxID=2989684 RepID=UPI003D17CC1A
MSLAVKTKRHRIAALLGGVVGLAIVPRMSLAAVEGTVDVAEYNLTLATQTAPTGFGNNQSELNQALGRINPDGSFQLALTGNLEGAPFSNGIVIFLDTKSGGAIAGTTPGGYGVFGSVGGAKTDDWGTDTDGGPDVSPPPGGPSIVSPGFNPDYSIEINNFGGGPNYYINVIDLTIPNEPNPNRDVFLSDPLDSSRSGLLNSGTSVTSIYYRDSGAGSFNAGEVTHAFNNTNTAGVNGTGDPAGLGDPTTATTGVELLLSTLFLNADPGQEIKLLAFITNDAGNYLSNQFLPGLPFDTPNLEGPGAGPGGVPLFDAENGFTSPMPNFYITVPLPEWGNSGGGDWSVDANWLIVRPEGINTTAKFGSAIAADATVNVDGAHTVGGIIFDNASNDYTLGGSAGSLTFDALAGKQTRINVVAGSHAITVPMFWQKDMRLSVSSGGLLDLSNSTVTPAAGITLTKDGGGTAIMQHVRTSAVAVQEGSLRIAAGTLANQPAGTSRVDSLSIATGARLDLNNNSLIVNSGSLATVTASIKSALENGGNFDWLGPGIGSTQANVQNTTAGSFLYGLGVVLNDLAQVGGSGPIYTDFAGQTLTGNEILVKFTYFGDADLSGSIDATDYSLIDNGYVNSLSGWINGDFDYSGSIDATDYALIDNAYVNQAGPLAEALIAEHARMFGGEYLAALRAVQSGVIPEPASLGLLLGAACSLKRSRRARRN